MQRRQQIGNFYLDIPSSYIQGNLTTKTAKWAGNNE